MRTGPVACCPVSEPSGFAHSCSVSDSSPVTSTLAPHSRAAIAADARSGRPAGHIGLPGGAACAATGQVTASYMVAVNANATRTVKARPGFRDTVRATLMIEHGKAIRLLRDV